MLLTTTVTYEEATYYMTNKPTIGYNETIQHSPNEEVTQLQTYIEYR